MIAKTFTVNSTHTRKLQSHFKPIYAEMAAAAAAAPADGAPAPDPDPAPAPARPPPKGAGLTKLCPSCGVRRPSFHFIRRNGKSLRNLVMNCATCRGFQPRDPRIAVNNADGGDANGDGKQFPDTILTLLSRSLPSTACPSRLICQAAGFETRHGHRYCVLGPPHFRKRFLLCFDS